MISLPLDLMTGPRPEMAQLKTHALGNFYTRTKSVARRSLGLNKQAIFAPAVQFLQGNGASTGPKNPKTVFKIIPWPDLIDFPRE